MCLIFFFMKMCYAFKIFVSFFFFFSIIYGKILFYGNVNATIKVLHCWFNVNERKKYNDDFIYVYIVFNFSLKFIFLFILNNSLKDYKLI